jgi:hypothetical protein
VEKRRKKEEDGKDVKYDGDGTVSILKNFNGIQTIS